MSLPRLVDITPPEDILKLAAAKGWKLVYPVWIKRDDGEWMVWGKIETSGAIVEPLTINGNYVAGPQAFMPYGLVGGRNGYADLDSIQVYKRYAEEVIMYDCEGAIVGKPCKKYIAAIYNIEIVAGDFGRDVIQVAVPVKKLGEIEVKMSDNEMEAFMLAPE